MRKLLVYLVLIILLFVFYNFFHSNDSRAVVKQDAITKSFSIDLLRNDTYYLPAKKFQNPDIMYQPLKRFDLIFTGHDLSLSTTAHNIRLISEAIPGNYTHMLMYLGKDSQGFAYGVEMNSDISSHLSLGVDGLELDGHLYVYCLGNDFGKKECPKDDYKFGLEGYDYIWAKRLKPQLHHNLLKNGDNLIKTIKQDLISSYPFELQFEINKKILETRKVQIVDNGRKGGADCASYFISLFEEKASICLENVRMDAKELENYFKNDPIGQRAYIPLKYNLLTVGDLHFKNLIEKQKYSFIDNVFRKTQCAKAQIVKGFVTPDLVFNSPSLKEIKGMKYIP